jgi:heptosyltransferase-1
MGWWGMWRTFKGFGRELRSFGYEIAVDVQSLAKSAYLAKASGARVIVGYARPEGREFSNWFHTVDVLPGNDVPHVVDRNLSLLTPLGVKRAPARFVFPDFADEYEALDPYFKVLGAPPAVLQPGTNWPNKRWPVEHFGELARLLVAERALPVAVAAHGDLELSWAEAIRRASGDRVSIAPPMGVRKLAAFMSRAAVVVGCDTGPVHLAWAQGVPTVALFGPTTGSRNGPIGGHARWVDAGLGCIGCWRDRCPDRTDACMRAITPERVFDLVQDVLAAR